MLEDHAGVRIVSPAAFVAVPMTALAGRPVVSVAGGRSGQW
jgi:hypothetical protein